MPDPYSENTKLRSLIDHGPSFVFRLSKSTQQQCLDEASRLSDRFPEIVGLKIYKIFPHCFLVITNSKMFWQPYDCSGRGVTAPVMEVRSGSPLYLRYVEHFDRFWQDDKLSKDLRNEEQAT